MLAINKAKTNFESVDNTAEFSVQVLQNERQRDYELDYSLSNAQKRRLIIQFEQKKQKDASLITINKIEKIAALISGATILCSEAIQKIDYNKIKN